MRTEASNFCTTCGALLVRGEHSRCRICKGDPMGDAAEQLEDSEYLAAHPVRWLDSEKGEPMEPVEVEARVVPQETALAAPESHETRLTLLRAQDPAGMVLEATQYANALADVIEKRRLFAMIKARKHVLVEGWTFLGSMLGVYPVVAWSRHVYDPVDPQVPIGWEARVEAKTIRGAVVGAAEASCLYSEANWKGREDYAVRSMAQTRATGKALRLPLGFIVSLAGYEACPAEEMPVEAPAKPSTIESASNPAPTKEWLAQAKANREAAAETIVPIQEQLERVRREANEKAGRPKSVPEFCSACDAPVMKFVREDDKLEYWECHTRNADRHKMKEAGVSEKDIRSLLSGHFFKWAGKMVEK